MSSKPDQRPTKRDAFQAFLREGWVSVHLDARRPGVKVPAHLRTEPRLVLQYGQDMPLPIPDLDVSDVGIRATLSFARTPQETMVPWSAVYIIACTDGRGVLYQEDIPEELLSLVEPVDAATGRPVDPTRIAEAPAEALVAEAGLGADSGAELPVAAPVRALRSVPLEGEADVDEDDGVGSDRKPRRRKPVLRVVK